MPPLSPNLSALAASPQSAPGTPSLSTPIGNTGISVDPAKAARTAMMVAKNVGRKPLDAGGNALRGAINNFSQARNAEFDGSRSNSSADDQILRSMLWQQQHQLATAEPPQQKQQSIASNYGDLGDEIDKGAKFLEGKPDTDDTGPVAGQPAKNAIVNAATGRKSGAQGNASVPNLTLTPVPSGAPSDASSLIDRTKYGLAGVESAGSKNPYATLGPVLKTGDRAYGKYQVMGENIPSWTKDALGMSLTPEQFLRDPDAQERTVSDQLGKILDANGNDPRQAASVWFTGRRLEDVNPNASDGYTTNAEYQQRFAHHFNSYPQPTDSAQDVQPPVAPPTPVQSSPLPPPTPAPSSAPPSPQLNNASAGPQAQAQPMTDQSNLYDKLAFSPDVQAGYDNPQVLFDPSQAPSAARGGYIRRADGGPTFASMPTNELIAQALRIINRRKRYPGGSVEDALGLEAGSEIAAQEQSGSRGGTDEGNPDAGLVLDAIARDNSAPGPTSTPQQPAPTTPNTPAVPAGQVGNQGGGGPGIDTPPAGNSIANYGANPSPIPMAAPTPYTGTYYNNTLDQVLGTNNPTQSQIFGFNYPQNLPAPKAQPQGPISQDEINGLYGWGTGSQIGTGLHSGGAIVMDALNRARRATKGKINV